MIKAQSNRITARNRLAIPAMGRQPVALPDSCTTLPLMGQAALTEPVPFHPAIKSPSPRKNAIRALLKRIFG